LESSQRAISRLVALSAARLPPKGAAEVPRSAREQYSPLGNASVTKSLSTKDKEFWSPPAVRAREKEVARLNEMKVWDFDHVREAADVKNEDPEAEFAHVTVISVIKHFELSLDDQKHKGRCVAGGHDVRDVYGRKIARHEGDEAMYVLPVGLR
jgi:hypothetical protein